MGTDIVISFKNAVVRDTGYGVEVNGKKLDYLISEALGTRVGNRYGWGSNLPDFDSNSCDVYVKIEPHPIKTSITTRNGVYVSLENFEEAIYEQFKEKDAETEPEE